MVKTAKALTPEMIEDVKLEQRHFRLIAFILRCTVKGYGRTVNEATKRELRKRAVFWANELNCHAGTTVMGNSRFSRDKFIKAVVTGEV